MDFTVDATDVGIVVLQDLWNSVALGAKELAKETNDMMFEKHSCFRDFSKQLAELNILLQTLRTKRVESTTLGSTTTALETLHSQLKNGGKIIKEYKSRSQIHRILKSHSVLKQMNELAKGMAETISSLELTNIDAALGLKSKTEEIINNLRSVEFQSAAATEAIASEIENSMAQNGKKRDHTVELLCKISEAVGVNMDVSLVQNEIQSLKREKEEIEAQKQQAEVFQLSQLIQLLSSSEILSCPPEELTRNQHNNVDPIIKCPLCHELMTDPVATSCGHSFERRAIKQYFEQGNNTCPICEQELSSMELTPNLSLRSNIEGLKQREVDQKFQNAVSGISSSDHEILNKAFDDLQAMIEVPRFEAKVSEEGLISKMVEFIEPSNPNAQAALKCLYRVCCLCDKNMEVIVKAGAIHHIVKRFYKGNVELEAIAILSELSAKEALAEEIGNCKGAIPFLVSLLHNNNLNNSQKAKEVLQNLSWSTHFVIKMAEVGYFQPFISHFNKVPSDARASMAAALVKMQIGDNNIEIFEHKQFIHKLIRMLSSSPASTMACLKCIKKLLVYQRMVKLFLADTTISFLIGIISAINPEEHCKLEASEVLTSLIATSHSSDFQRYPNLQELESEHNVNLFKRLATTPDPHLKAHFLQLLLVLICKSETARNLVRSDKDAVGHLFSSLQSDQPEVRRRVMKLIYCISEDHPAGVPLPESSEKEHAINALVNVLTSSPDIKEKSTAAGIISLLPATDISIDEILFKSEALKAIQEVISATDNEHSWTNAPIISDESLIENALAVLIRYTLPTKPKLQGQLYHLNLHTLLIRLLSRGSSLAKQRTATALAHLSQSTNLSINETNNSMQANNYFPLPHVKRLFPVLSRCFSTTAADKSMCTIHGSACSSRHTFCLVKADAVGPLLQTLNDRQSGAAEAALIALNTLLTGSNTLSHAATIIVENKGIDAILEVLEKGTLSAKDKALDLFRKILQHTDITNTQSKRSERILIHLLTEDELKKKAALVLRQMNLLPEQSSYF